MANEFHSARKQKLDDGATLADVVEQTFLEFNRKKPLNDRIGQATAIATVWPANEKEYYAVLIIGPTKNLEALASGLTGAAGSTIPDVRKLGIE